MLTIHYQNSEVSSYLERLRARLGDLQPVLQEIGTTIEGRVSARFETETDPLGRSWHPWAASTAQSYPRPGSKAAKAAGRAGNARILDRYGDMLGGLSHQADKDSVRIGFAHPYATYHEFGTKKMPRRGLLFSNPETGELPPEDTKLIIDILQRHLNA